MPRLPILTCVGVSDDLYRAYSLVTVKDFDPIQRTFSGIATSPVADRVGDVIESDGITAKSTIPLLLYHNSTMPVGEARLGKAGKHGTPFTARISTLDKSSGKVKERLDEAVDSLAADPPLIRGVSIGFNALEPPTFNKDTGGFTFSKIEVLELSMVTIPAHQDATIATVKSLCAGSVPAFGQSVSTTSTSAGVSASPRALVKTTTYPPKKADMKSLADQIKDFEASRAAKQAAMEAVQAKAAGEGRSKDETEKQEFASLRADIAAIDEELSDLREMERVQKSAAVPVVTTPATTTGVATAQHVITVKENTPPGIGFARALMCKMAAYLDHMNPVEIAKARYPHDPRVANYIKATVNAATTQDSTWAAPLVYADNLASEFIAYLRPQTIVGKFGTGGIPALRSVPFNVRIPRATSGLSASWVGEGQPKPLTSAALDTVTLTYTKVAAIAVITQELARFSSPSAEGYVRDELARACVSRIDTDFIDPAKAASSYVNPASITNGVTALSSAGTSADNVRTDVQNLLEQFILNNLDTSSLVLIMPNTLAMVLAILHNATTGVREFPEMTINGGSLLGIPVIASQYAASGASYGNMVIAVKADDIALADDGRVSVDVSSEASLQMLDNPTNASSNGTATTMVSMFQTNSLAVRAEREIHWAKLRSTAVAYMDDVNWGAIGSPV